MKLNQGPVKNHNSNFHQLLKKIRESELKDKFPSTVIDKKYNISSSRNIDKLVEKLIENDLFQLYSVGKEVSQHGG